ncbi:MAG: trypsin-like peptidase domain-containing protein [Thermoanaerobaculia bacterium]
MRRLAVVVLALSSAAGAGAATASRRNEIVEVVEKVAPGVVNISAEQTVRRSPLWDDFFFGLDRPRRERARSLGSGAIIDPRGIILTNDHVISGASRIVATTKSGAELECEVVGSDADNDLAVLRVRNPGGSLPSLKLGTSSDLLIGETILAIGNPFGYTNTVTSGVVSAVGRSVRGQNNQRSYTDFIQIDAPINPGNSGGPVVNIQGDVIGIATAIAGGAQGIGFAIPVDRARRIVEDLLQFGEVRAAWIGLRARSAAAADGEAPGRGLRVRSVFPDSPAASAGIRAGETVVSVDGVPLDSEDAFETALSTRGPGRSMKLGVRGEKGPERVVTLQAQAPPPGLGIRILREDIGISLRRVSGALRISVVDADSLAARRGLRSGDLLLGVNRTPVEELDDADRILLRDHNRRTVLLEVGRGRFAYVLTFPLD